jgi:hypothetical protein
MEMSSLLAANDTEGLTDWQANGAVGRSIYREAIAKYSSVQFCAGSAGILSGKPGIIFQHEGTKRGRHEGLFIAVRVFPTAFLRVTPHETAISAAIPKRHGWSKNIPQRSRERE